jgi:predicted phage tail component-like protein
VFSFTYLSKNSFTDYGILVATRPIIPKPQRHMDYIDVPGRSGSLRVDYETYADIMIPVICSFRDADIPGQADEVKAWLNGGEGQLIFSNQTDRYYLAHVSDQFDIAQEYKIFGKFQVDFRCRPFKYAVTNTPVTLTEAGAVTNPGNINSEPVILVTGSGAITLTINGTDIVLADVVDNVTIDSVLKDSYKGTVLKNSKMTGEFPLLTPGSNSFSWSGTVTSVEVTGNWRWL